MSKIRNNFFIPFASIAAMALLFSIGFAQSTSQSNPTAVTSNEINGVIPARAIGDSRLTNHFYAFDGEQGDVFINIVTENLDGDIDVFTLNTLQALTKITVFSDNANSETGRIIYLRKPENLLLRVQGRSPNDEQATYQIKFAGSFRPLTRAMAEVTPLKPEVRAERPGDVIVNSVGTIIGVVPKPEPAPKIEKPVEKAKVTEKEITVTSSDQAEKIETSAKIEIRRESAVEVKEEETKPALEGLKTAKPVVIITDDTDTIEKAKAEEDPRTDATSPATPESAVEPMNAEQLSKIQLVVSFKDGRVLRQAMNTVFSFNVNQGILTIVSNDGKISKYSLLVIDKIAIE